MEDRSVHRPAATGEELTTTLGATKGCMLPRRHPSISQRLAKDVEVAGKIDANRRQNAPRERRGLVRPSVVFPLGRRGDVVRQEKSADGGVRRDANQGKPLTCRGT
jgi:hypothetical protein